MGLSNDNRIGRTGPGERYKIPPGFILYKFTRTRDIDQRFLVAGSSTAFMQIDGDKTKYSNGELEVLITEIHGKEASRAWSAAGSNPRLDGFLDAYAMNGVTGLSGKRFWEEKDSYIESVSCDSADVKISEIEFKNSLSLVSTGDPDLEPRVQINNFFEDAPGSRSICLSRYRLNAYVLIKKGLVVSVNEEAGDTWTVVDEG